MRARISRRRALSLFSAAGFALLAEKRASASLARALSVAELVRRSDAVVLLTPLAAKSQWETIYGRRRIVTYTEVRIDEMMAGAVLTTPLLVRTLGGRVDRDAQIVHGESVLLIGELGVAFVRQSDGSAVQISGMSQGYYPVFSASDGSRLRGNTQGFKLSGRGAVHELGGRTLAEARTIIQRAWDAR
jgi:hypothetical protein